jgi:hypothetical protein
MKIRIKGNSIRFRLTKTNVTELANTGSLEDRTIFPDGNQFTYRLIKKDGINKMSAGFENDCITVYLPADLTNEWATSDQVGMQHTAPLSNGEDLFLLVEKDFVCLDHTFEDQSDNYPNPNKTC